MFVLYHPRSRPSGRALAQALGADCGLRTRRVPLQIVRWGTARQPEADDEISCVLNRADAVARAANKYRSLEVMRAAGVSVPRFARSAEAMRDWPDEVRMGRSDHHSQGSDIRVLPCDDEPDFTQSDYYTLFIPTKREYRIHVFRDKIIRVQGKYLDFPDQAHPYIRNYEHGYRFRQPSLTLRPARLEAAIEAVKALGLDFGAVDLIIGEDGNHYVLEVNTAPKCSPLTLSAYVEAIREGV